MKRVSDEEQLAAEVCKVAADVIEIAAADPEWAGANWRVRCALAAMYTIGVTVEAALKRTERGLPPPPFSTFALVYAAVQELVPGGK